MSRPSVNSPIELCTPYYIQVFNKQNSLVVSLNGHNQFSRKRLTFRLLWIKILVVKIIIIVQLGYFIKAFGLFFSKRRNDRELLFRKKKKNHKNYKTL